MSEIVITKEHILKHWEYRDGGIYKLYSPKRFGKSTVKSGRRGTLFQLPVYEHEIVYFLFNDVWPEFVMHKDHDPENNDIDNLHAWGRFSKTTPFRARSLKSQYDDIKGVYHIGHYSDGRPRFQATIKVGAITINLYCGDDYLQAVSARKYAETIYNRLKHVPVDKLTIVAELSKLTLYSK